MSWPSSALLPAAAATLVICGCAIRSSNDLASCCATNQEAAGTFTDKSLYQLDSTWKTDTGKPVKLETLQGRVEVVVMFFASC